MKQIGPTPVDQLNLFGEDAVHEEEPVIASESDVRELAREYFGLREERRGRAESEILAARRRLHAHVTGAGRRGLVAKWADYETAKGYVSVHDPIDGEWVDIRWKDAPSWARWEAGRRAGLTAGEMEEIWRGEHQPEEDYIVEDHPIEENDEGGEA